MHLIIQSSEVKIYVV